MSSAKPRPFALVHLDAALLQELQRRRAKPAPDRLLPGLCITDEEIDEVVAGLPSPTLDRLASRLARLGHRFGLTPLDLDILQICVAPEFDVRYERVYAYLQDDATARRPGVDLIQRLLGNALTDPLRVRRRLAASAPLRAWQIVHLEDQAPGSLPATPAARVDDAVVEFLGGLPAVDARLAGVARLTPPQAALDDLVLAPGLAERLHRVAAIDGPERRAPALHFHGRRGSGRRSAAAAMCRARRRQLLVVSADALGSLDPAQVRTTVRAIVRDALLHDRMPLVGDLDAWFLPERAPWLQALLDELLSLPGPFVLASEGAWSPAWDADRELLRLEFPPLSYDGRIRAWRSALEPGEVSDEEVAAIAGAFRLTAGRIHAVAAEARAAARLGGTPLTIADVRRACQAGSTRGLTVFGRALPCRRTWRDLVLPADRRQQLQEVCRAVRHRSRVYDGWGFDAKLSLGKGLNALFTGPPGTGKTLAAEVIGSELGLAVYRVDLSAIVSKYIGETEKHLARVFADADASDAVLFFDEADALFGQRTEVKDAHDRFANIEVSYLLTRLEQHEGVVILASNLRKNVDEAFVRRMHFIVEFPMPTPAERRVLWDAIWPEQAPLAGDVDAAFLAAQYELSGGHIRNAALAAAFLAAEQDSAITMAHVIAAVRREYQKMGTIVLDHARWAHPSAPVPVGEARAVACANGS